MKWTGSRRPSDHDIRRVRCATAPGGGMYAASGVAKGCVCVDTGRQPSSGWCARGLRWERRALRLESVLGSMCKRVMRWWVVRAADFRHVCKRVAELCKAAGMKNSHLVDELKPSATCTDRASALTSIGIVGFVR